MSTPDPFAPVTIHLYSHKLEVQTTPDEISATYASFCRGNPAAQAWRRSLQHLPKRWSRKQRTAERARLLKRGYMTPEELALGHRKVRFVKAPRGIMELMRETAPLDFGAPLPHGRTVLETFEALADSLPRETEPTPLLGTPGFFKSMGIDPNNHQPTR